MKAAGLLLIGAALGLLGLWIALEIAWRLTGLPLV